MGVTQKIGTLGEELAVKFLVRKGHTILDRNYRRPWGELDIVSRKKDKIHFVEVKALSQSIVSDETLKNGSLPIAGMQGDVTHETFWLASLSYIKSKVKKDRFRAEDRVNTTKMKRLSHIIQTYLVDKHVSDETNWQFDIATVLIDGKTKKAKIELIEEIPI